MGEQQKHCKTTRRRPRGRGREAVRALPGESWEAARARLNQLPLELEV